MFPVVSTVLVELGNVIVVPSVPAKVRLLLTASVLPFVNVNVPVVLVIVRPLKLVPVATTRTGVTSVGDVARTTEPVPVLAVAATPLMLKLLPVPAVSYVLLVRVAVLDVVSTVTPSTLTTPAETRASVVSEA